MTALRAKALTHGLTVGGYRLDCYFDGCQIWVIANRVWDNVGEDVAILLCEDFGTVLPTGWQFYIDFVIPKGFDTDGTPILEGVFSDTYEVASSA